MANKKRQMKPAEPPKKRLKTNKSDKSNGIALTEEVTNIDALNWQTVQPPDILEDAEGFYGLEEIEGVDIVRPADGEQLKFLASKGSIKTGNNEDLDDDDDGEEWEGFSDEVAQQPEPEKLPSKSTENKKKKDKEREKPRQEKDNAKVQSIPFSVLNEADEEADVDVSAWDSLDLRPELQTSLSRLKFAQPTPIQKATIPEILSGRDVIGKAATGSGKTLAFGLPILQYLLKRQEKRPSALSKSSDKSPIALILSPTRELAHQLVKHLKEVTSSAPNVDAYIASVTGGLSVHKQQRQLAEADIVVGTPGRLWDMVSSTPKILTKLRSIKFLVVDEADRLLSEGHFKEVGELLSALDKTRTSDEDVDEASEEEEEPASRQTLVFSATFQKGLQQKLAKRDHSFHDNLLDKKESMEYLLKKLRFKDEKPRFIDVNPVSQMADNLKEGIIECSAMEKDLYLYSVLLFYPKHRTLVFTNSISSVRRLTQFLQNLNLPALSLHSSMAQKARLRAVERFSSPTADPSPILIATDVAARGLDMQGIDLVIHYHVPRTADTYIHRSGRTARASASGKSILICAPEETAGVTRLVAKVHHTHKRKSSSKDVQLHSIHLDRGIVTRLRPRANLSKKITESTLAKEKISSETDWLRSAAEDLGVDYDSEEFAEQESKSRGRGRGGGRQAKERQASNVSKAEMARLRAELRDLLSKRVNLGVSERYLTSGRLDIGALLKSEGNPAFLGHVEKPDF
ncbi:ATP-dependent RNA helicase [Trichophyton interdigitale]|uniref:ATP-dependent RNA helicase n=1 Tax=Trichophyton interdigitale TaxID=101480 RepID=A0A9P4YGY2_9EURO|nr:ATP-dependent RNA helicase [Trichophyton interdigitale]KAF3896938.1 ATP-dependent RNA helicase [Trichophyton interdigitale]KAG8209372.1 ATP-dependent RNA helicase [Trichophyton interdigitale]